MIHLWDMVTFEKTRSLRGHLHEVWNLKFSSDGLILASASSDHTVKLWRLRPQAQANTESEHLVPKDYFCRGFSQSGDVLRFHDRKEWETGLDAARPLTDHLLDLVTDLWTPVTISGGETLAQTRSVRWASDHDMYLFGKENGTVVLSDGTTTQSIQVTDHPVEPLLLSPKGRYLLLNVLTKNAGRYAILWDIENEEIIGQYPYLRGQAISPDERFLAYTVWGDHAVSGDFAVRLWHIPEKREWATLRGHAWHVDGATFSPDSRLLASFSWDNTCRLWDVEKGSKATPHLLRGHRAVVYHAAFSPDGRTLATASDDFSYKLWSVATGQEMLSFPAPQLHTTPINKLHMMAAEADRLVWGGPAGQPWGTIPEVALRVVTLPSLLEIDEEIRRRSSAEQVGKSE